jgi:pyruvate ferredoxin oxidoreductase gamma subunit
MGEHMFAIRIHGRGGQGIVTAAEMMSVAAFREGDFAQAFPSFGSERLGAPIVAFCRIHHGPIRSREPISTPDALIIQVPALRARRRPHRTPARSRGRHRVPAHAHADAGA